MVYGVNTTFDTGEQLFQPYGTLYLAMREARQAEHASHVTYVAVVAGHTLVHEWGDAPPDPFADDAG